MTHNATAYRANGILSLSCTQMFLILTYNEFAYVIIHSQGWVLQKLVNRLNKLQFTCHQLTLVV